MGLDNKKGETYSPIYKPGGIGERWNDETTSPIDA